MTPILNSIADWLVAGMFLPLLAFIILYVTRSAWWETELGISVLFQKIGFIAIVSVILLSIALGEYPGRPFVRIAIYGTFSVLLWLDVANLLRYQHGRDPFEIRPIQKLIHRARERARRLDLRNVRRGRID